MMKQGDPFAAFISQNRQGSTAANRAMEARQRQTRYKQRVEIGRENQNPVKQSWVRAGREGSATINNPWVKHRTQTQEHTAQNCNQQYNKTLR